MSSAARRKEASFMSQKQTNALRVVLLTVAIVFILAGLFRDEAGVVLMKAVFICLECIGIG